ncbi:hypothetical protein J2Z34_001981 [Youngiibacter multivorans]|uniref:Uncharacterized protein n=1 Tax=Youngiibacter multivorans TaxID=937251 RepID=A0ABS4G4M3_9CLOT|nr:hypothetical protein [Youngiibacter multivorans]
MTVVLDGGFNVFAPANTKCFLVGYLDTMIVAQVISNSAITLVWTFSVDFFGKLSDTLIFQFS